MNVQKQQTTRFVSAQLIAGLVIVLVGALLLLDQFGVMGAGNIFRFFPLLFIALAVWQLVTNRFQSWTGPVILIVVMSLIQLSILGIVNGAAVWRLWPLALILAGGTILLRQYRGEDAFGASVDTGDRFNVFALFSGAGRTITSQSFQGGEVTTMFGGAEIDLSQMQVASPPAVINVFVMFGGVGLKASPDTTIDLQALALFGGVGDERKQRKRLAGEPPEVIIKGLVLFGGVGIEPARSA